MSDSMSSKEEAIAKYKKLKGKRAGLIFVIAAGLAAMTIIAFAVGGSSVGLGDIFCSIGDFFTGNETVSDTQRYISLDIRLPRVLTCIAAGSSLALAGLLMQGIFQNPLVSPYTLGISSAASFGASLAIIFLSGVSAVVMGSYMTPLLAFGFSVLAMLLVFGTIFGLIVVISAFPMALLGIIPQAIVADVAEEDAIVTGEKREGMFFAARTFAMKFGQSVAMLVFTSLAVLGTTQDLKSNDLTASPIGLRIVAIVAVCFCVLGAIILMAYDEKKVMKTITDNAEK